MEGKILEPSKTNRWSIAKTILTKGCDGFFQKPFGTKKLSQKLSEILDQG